MAAMHGQTRMVEFLLRRGARPDLPDDPPWATPVAWATRRGHEDVVRLLGRYEEKGELPARSLETYESLARDLVDAYGPGDEDALRRIMEHFRIERPLTWDNPPLAERARRLRRVVREHLASMPGAEVPGDTLPLSTARRLIARAEGFAGWREVVESLAGGR